MKKFLYIIPLLVLGLALAGCTKQSDTSTEASKEEKPIIYYYPKKMGNEVPELTIDTTKTYNAKFKTNYGEFIIKLDAANKPVTVNSFVSLSNSKFYDGLSFHRIVDGFMIQGGDPNGDGTGDPGYSFKDELDTQNVNKKGTISMANSGPNTNGSQFFINLSNNNFLDTKHTVFGEVVSGMDVVEKIGKVEVELNIFGNEASVPVEPVLIETIEISIE